MEKTIKTFEQFSQAVEALSGGKYFAVRMEKTKHIDYGYGTREEVYHYQVYIDGANWYSGNSPELAIENLKNGLGLSTQRTIEAEIK